MIGIDPGLNGAIAFLEDSEAPCLAIWDMPTMDDEDDRQVCPDSLSAIFRENELTFDDCFIEFVHAAPGQGVSSTFKFGRGFGTALGVAASFRNRLTLVRPSVWKPKLKVPAGKSAKEKNANAIERASFFFPKSKNAWKRKKDADRAEAALIALYGQANKGPVYPVQNTYVNGELV